MEQKYIDKFYAKVSPEPNTGCWFWTGAIDKRGYGAFGISSGSKRVKSYKAHRFSALIHNMDMSQPIIRHLCNNRLCVNPMHLEPGTHYDNYQDRMAAGVPHSPGRPRKSIP